MAPGRDDRAPILSGALHLEDEADIGAPVRQLATNEALSCSLRFLDGRRAGAGPGFRMVTAVRVHWPQTHAPLIACQQHRRPGGADRRARG